MPTEQIGYRRLYDSMGCNLKNQEEIMIDFTINNIHVLVYMGPKPKYGLALMEGEKYVVPGEVNKMLRFKYFKDASKSPCIRHFFTEISCCKEIEISQEISEAFHSRKPKSEEPLLKIAHSNSDIFHTIINLVAGTIGLRYHWQFVTKVINENFFAIYDNNNSNLEIIGQSMKRLEQVSLRPEGRDVLTNDLKKMEGLTYTSRQSMANAFHWLMQSWIEDDITTKFINLFIPIEIILAGYSGIKDEIHLHQAESIRRIILDHGGEQKKTLMECLNYFVEQKRPTLVSRFEKLAEKAKMVGWEKDILAFKKFNSMRNSLLHKGQDKLTTRISLREDEVCDFEDIVERYINYTFFGDDQVYKSIFRPIRTE